VAARVLIVGISRFLGAAGGSVQHAVYDQLLERRSAFF
jgi:hypothetical protein